MDNSNSFIEFYDDAIEVTWKSEQEGRPVYEQRTMIRIITPGDSTCTFESLATDEHKRQYPKQYEAYQRQSGPLIEGTMLAAWPPINKSQCKEAQFFEIHTVEQLAGLTDSQVSRMGMGWQQLRTQAKAYLIAAKDSAHVTQQAAEMDRLKGELEAMRQQLAAISEAETKRPGRPRKETADV